MSAFQNQFNSATPKPSPPPNVPPMPAQLPKIRTPHSPASPDARPVSGATRLKANSLQWLEKHWFPIQVKQDKATDK